MRNVFFENGNIVPVGKHNVSSLANASEHSDRAAERKRKNSEISRLGVLGYQKLLYDQARAKKEKESKEKFNRVLKANHEYIMSLMKKNKVK